MHNLVTVDLSTLSFRSDVHLAGNARTLYMANVRCHRDAISNIPTLPNETDSILTAEETQTGKFLVRSNQILTSGPIFCHRY